MIDLDLGTVEHLQAHRLRQQQERSEWDSDYQDQDLVFCREDGMPIRPHSFSQHSGGWCQGTYPKNQTP